MGQPLGQCEASLGLRDTDLNTIRRYEHTDIKLGLGEIERLGQVDEERAEDAQMTGIVGTPINFPPPYRGNREGV